MCFILHIELICSYLYPYVAVHKWSSPPIHIFFDLPRSFSLSSPFISAFLPHPFYCPPSFSLPHLFTVPFLLPFLLCLLVCLGSCHFTFFAHLIQFDSNKKIINEPQKHTLCYSKGKHLFSSLTPLHPSWHTQTHLMNTPNIADFASVFSYSFLDSIQNKTGDSKEETDLFDAVWVNGGLRLQDADRLCLLGTLRHLPHLLSNEVMDAVQGFDCSLDQAHPLCRPCTHTRRQTGHGMKSNST